MAKHIAYDEVAGLDDAMPAGEFRILFGTIPGGGDANQLSLRCQQVVIPGMDNEVMPVTLHQFDFIFSGKNTFPKVLVCSFVEGAKNMPAHKALVNWQQAVRGTKSGTAIGYIKDYSITAELHVFDSSGATARKAKIEKLLIQSVPDTQLDSTSVQPMLINATFGYWKTSFDGIAER